MTEPEVDLLDLLSADHENLLHAESDSIVLLVSQHLGVERDLLYPEIRFYVEDGGAVEERLRGDELRLEEHASAFEQHPSPEARAALDRTIRSHIGTMEREFPTLRDQIPAARLQELTSVVPMTLGSAPTHSHPHLAEGGLIGEAIEDLTSVTDRLSDRLHHPLHPTHEPEPPES